MHECPGSASRLRMTVFAGNLVYRHNHQPLTTNRYHHGETHPLLIRLYLNTLGLPFTRSFTLGLLPPEGLHPVPAPCRWPQAVWSTCAAAPHCSSLPPSLQVASGMAYLHSCTPLLIHRDLKPENVLIGDEAEEGDGGGTGIAKLCDFGLMAVSALK